MFKIKSIPSGAYSTEDFNKAFHEATLVYNEIIKSNEYQDSLGWLDPQKWASDFSIANLLNLTNNIKEEDAVLVLIGVGGSNNGARAAIHALKCKRQVIYAGNNLSADYYNKLFESLSGKSVYINVIAKNFETLEPGLSFRLFRHFLKERYGKDYNKRVYVTGTPGSQLHDLCKRHQFTFLTFPEDIGGRFSVLSDVGLFPMAFAGIDIRAMVDGAKDMKTELSDPDKNKSVLYAATRHLLYQKNYAIEMLASFEPRLEFFSKWWIQLFAESEGKENKGLYPVASTYSEDLHSIGQYVQDGRKIIFETFIHVENPESNLHHFSDCISDGFDYLNGKSLTQINEAAYEATIKAHHEEGIPEVIISLPKIDAYHLGQLFFFFETSVYLSGRLLKINPFDQPGVENYKKYMFHNLGK
ncbi:glucose-6-phosphate isomerase [Proteiniclasticum sp. C24MP]|uniref:glucose-6-phosphate isomerase n=1 Tax=Proteiniclasticum sp. C24MP TaxID=3374101 RepID=UPI0037542253